MYLENWVWWVIRMTQWVMTQEDVVRQIVKSDTNDAFHVWMSAVSCSVLQCVVFQRSAVSWVVTQSWHNESWHSHYAISHDTERRCASNSWVRYERCISRMDECSVLSQKDVVHQYDTGILRIIHVTRMNDFIHIQDAMIPRIMTEWVTTQEDVVYQIVECHMNEWYQV